MIIQLHQLQQQNTAKIVADINNPDTAIRTASTLTSTVDDSN